MSPPSSTKTDQVGLVDMGNIQFYDGFGSTGYTPKTVSSTETLPDLAQFTGLFSEVVLNVTWAQLQPTPGASGIVTTVIDDAIAAVESYNATNHTNLGIKLRIWGGYTAPDWAKNIDGPPITVTGQSSVDPNVFTPQTIGRYWTADYVEPWTNLQNALGTQYDSNPVIRGISQTAGAGTSDEPFVPFSIAAPKTSPTDPVTVNQVQELQRGGYNDASEALTLRTAIADYAQWSTTPLDYTMNNHYVFDSGAEHDDPNFTLAVLQQARNSTRIVQAGNHRLQSPIYTADNFLYGQMAADAALDPSTARGSFQTASPDGLMGLTSQITDPSTYPDFPVTGSYAVWPYSIATGVASNAGNVEFWDYSGSEPGFPVIDGFLNLSLSQAQFLSTMLAAGTAPTTGAPLDGSALGFVAPASVTGAPGTVALSGIHAVLLASAAAQTSYTVTLTSTHGGALAVKDVFGGVVSGPTSGSTLTLSGPFDRVNTVLASLTDTLASGTDVIRLSATDTGGDSAVLNVGVQIASPGSSPTPSPGAAPSAFQSDGILAVGGVLSSFSVPGNLQIGSGGTATTLLAALAPNAYSTASLTIGGTLEMLSGGAAWFTGSLVAPTVTVDVGGAIHGDGTLTASGAGPITNDGTIEAVADLTLGLQRLTVASGLTGSGTGKLIIDAGATLVLGGTVSSQAISFAPNNNAQFSNGPYSPSTLELVAPLSVSAPISGFTFADRLILDGLSLTTADVTYDSVAQKLHVNVSGTNHDFDLSGNLAGLDPLVTSGNIIQFVAPPAGIAPSVTAPLTLEGADGVKVLVPGIVLNTPLPATAPGDLTVEVTLVAAAGTLSAGNNAGQTTVGGNNTGTLTLSGLVASVERSLQTLTYRAPAATSADTITIDISNYAGSAAALATITVSNNAAPQQFDWAAAVDGSFADPLRWAKPGGGSETTAPGFTNIAAFGAGAYTVSDDGAVGEIVVTGAPTLTGHVDLQGLSSLALKIDSGGILTLAGGAVLSAGQQAIVGDSGDGLLAVMGGALDLTGPSTSNALVVGALAGSNGTVLNLEQITALGTVVVGEAGTGLLELRGVASSVSDGGADIGQSAGSHGSVTVNGGEWTNSGQLIVGDAGTGSLLIDGMNNGIAGQVTAFDATIGNQAGGQGSVTLDGGEFLVANDQVPINTLSVGGAGTGTLTLRNGSEVAVGAALGKPSNNSTTVYPNTGVFEVGTTAGGNGQVSISGNSALLVYGAATVGGPGTGRITVGTSADDIALFALMGALTVNSSGQVGLGGANATLHAGSFDINSGGLISGAGTLSGVGGGNQTIMPATIDNNGTIEATGGNLVVYGNVAGTGVLSIESGATMTLEGEVGSNQTLAFSSNARVVIADPTSFHGTITGFDDSDVLVIGGVQATSVSWASGVLTLGFPSGPLQYILSGNFDDGFATSGNGLGGSNVRANPSGVGGGHGDVHMITFDGLSYDFQAVGDFVAVQSVGASSPWEIQIRTISAAGATSITEGLGTMLGDDLVTFSVGRDTVVHVNGAADTSLQVGDVQRLSGGTLARLSADDYQLAWNDGRAVTVTDFSGWFLDWTVALGPQNGPGSVHGLLGSHTGQANDFQLPNGTVLGPLNDYQILTFYADAWRVGPGASLLDDSQAPAHAQLAQAMAAGLNPTGADSAMVTSTPDLNAQPAVGFLAPPHV